MLVMNYHRKAGTAPSTYIRTLNDGFPILNNTELGADESRSLGPGGSWGAMDFSVMAALPKLSEFRLFWQNGAGTVHIKSAERNSFQYIRTGLNDPNFPGYSQEDFTTPRYGLELLRMQPEYTPLPGHTQATLQDLGNPRSVKAVLAFEKNSLWIDGILPGDKYNTIAQLWLRGSGGYLQGALPWSPACGYASIYVCSLYSVLVCVLVYCCPA